MSLLQSKKTKLNEDSISKFSSSIDDHPLPGPVSQISCDADFELNKFKLKLILSSLFFSSSYSDSLYPLTFIPTMSVSDYVKHYSSLDDLVPPAQVSLAGLIIKKLTLSASTFIYELHCLEHKAKAQVQVIAEARNSYMEDAEFSRFHCSLKPGVFLGVSGLPGKNEIGDLAIIPSSFTVLTREPKKQLPQDPDWVRCFESEETISLERYRDIMMDKDVAPIVKLRYEIVRYVTSILKGHTLFKGGTPTPSNTLAWGRTALSRANDCYAWSYISPSLMVWDNKMSCSHDYAYEMGKKIRKEGIGLSQIPKLIEFELCVDFDFNDLMALTERILSEMVKDRIGGYRIKCHADGLNMDAVEFDFSPPFSKINIMEELNKLENLEKPELFSVDATNKYLSRACSKYDIVCSPPETNEQLLVKLVKHFLEKSVNPTFIIYHPNIMSPLEKCGLTQRFELYIKGHEIFNGYAALEDRLTQIQRIWNIKDRPLIESEEITLEHGLVTTGGWSLGMDRLTMLFANSESIEEATGGGENVLKAATD